MSNLTTIAQAHGQLGLSREVVRRKLRAGEIPGMKIGGRWMVDLSEFNAARLRAGDLTLACHWLTVVQGPESRVRELLAKTFALTPTQISDLIVVWREKNEKTGHKRDDAHF